MATEVPQARIVCLDLDTFFVSVERLLDHAPWRSHASRTIVAHFNPTMKLEIAGHTDNVGSESSNQQLSQSRAEAVVNYLTGNGAGKDRLIGTGYGERMPIADNDTDLGRQLNRRVEFKILNK